MKNAATIWLRTEGAVALGAALVLYGRGLHPYSWGWFAALFLVPDISMLGYLAGPRVGAIAYNLAHTYTLALGLLGLGLLLGQGVSIAGGIIWCAHIGFDRAMGYGLKLPEGFGHTHLGPIGRRR